MKRVDPWQVSNVPGPRMANVLLNPKIVAALLKRKRCLMIVGHEALNVKIDGDTVVDALIDLSKRVTIVATGHTVKAFLSKGVSVASMGLPEIVDKLRERKWKGLDGKGCYEVVMFIGFPYHLESQALASLKHFATHVQTVSLGRFYQPNANWSFPNMGESEWEEAFKTIVKGGG
jgi:acetyl-CoA decarbonylase/synthase complex subunit epsilon